MSEDDHTTYGGIVRPEGRTNSHLRERVKLPVSIATSNIPGQVYARLGQEPR
jgi:hypothetical protein